MYTPPVTPWELVTPEVSDPTFQEGAAEGGTDNWGEVVTRKPDRKVRLDHLLSKEEQVKNGFHCLVIKEQQKL